MLILRYGLTVTEAVFVRAYGRTFARERRQNKIAGIASHRSAIMKSRLADSPKFGSRQIAPSDPFLFFFSLDPLFLAIGQSRIERAEGTWIFSIHGFFTRININPFFFFF